MLRKSVSILHDNARSQAARQTVILLERFGWEIITHPPYSPDLACSNFHLFPKLKEHLSGMRFNNDDATRRGERCGSTLPQQYGGELV